MLTTSAVESFWCELEKIAQQRLGVPGVVPAFAGGIDPFGVYTSEIGQQAQRAGASRGQHMARDAAGTMGGIVGGAAILPAAIGAVAGAGRGFASSGGGLGRRLTGAAQEAFQGAVAPFKGLYHASRSSKALGRAATQGGTKLSPKEIESLKHTLGQTKMRAAAENAPADPRKALNAQAQEFDPEQAAALYRKVKGGTLPKEVGTQLQQPVATAVGSGATQLALGGAVGGLGAHVQYAKGRQSEKKFQKRLKK